MAYPDHMTHSISKLLILFCGCATNTIATAAERGPIALEPSSNWTVDYADDSCRLIRKFGAEDEIVFAIFNRFSPGDDFQLTVVGKPVALKHSTRPAAIQFGPTEAEQEHGFVAGTMGDGKPALIFHGQMRISPLTESEQEKIKKSEKGVFVLPPISEERKAAVTELTIGRPLSRPVTLKLGAMDKPFAALSTCQDELMTHWGIDVKRHRNLSALTRPDGNPGRWVNTNDYPRGMLAKGKEAIVHFRMSVDDKGDPTACNIQQSTRPKDFDDVVCRSLMKRAKFTPARDQQGKPIASYYRNSVRFRIP
ncbi:MAG: TonB family protein [Parasphingorhabdus sp.]|jgi:TonB family protein|uniref:energy transducer TonB n=1 Tax=Parasphingorhabdus sp. TaxID=2709688 RepID=UPI0039E54710|tara:strand:- start:6452 stop:7375 length:924 start_codon:yes stop_codon:yes gene_type:complete